MVDGDSFFQRINPGLNVALARPLQPGEPNWGQVSNRSELARALVRECCSRATLVWRFSEKLVTCPQNDSLLGAKAASIEFQAEGKRRSMRFGNIAAAEIEALPGQGTDDVVVDRPPFAAVPGVSFVVAKSKVNRFNDFGLNWEVSDKNGFFSPFTYQSA